MDKDVLKELSTLLRNNARPDVQVLALDNILAYTGDSDGLQLIAQSPDVLLSLLILLKSGTTSIAKKSASNLINISSQVHGATYFLQVDDLIQKGKLKTDPGVEGSIAPIVTNILNPDSALADFCCVILSNLTRFKPAVEETLNTLERLNIPLEEIINVFTNLNYNKRDNKLDYLASILSNLSQNKKVRENLLDKEKCLIQKLIPFTQFADSLVRRSGAVGALHNCCFETDYHSWLLNDVDILPYLLLPLADGTEYDEEDTDKLPLQLQYLPEDKKREEDAETRCMLIEAITQLCAKRESREYIRSKNAYVILRDLHKSEPDRKVLFACENLVDILIRTEEEIGENNLKELNIPEELQSQFEMADKELS